MEEELDTHFSKEDMKMANRHMKRCSVLLSIREIQSKSIRRYNSHQSEWASSKFMNNKCWSGCGEKGTLLHCCWICKFVQPLWRTVWRFLKKVKIGLPYGPAIPCLGTYPEKNITEKDPYIPKFIAALFTIPRTWKQPKCPSTEE